MMQDNLHIDYSGLENDRLVPDDAPIWVLWYQGENKMPDIVKACYLSVLRNAHNHPVHLLTSENLDEYIEIPQFIKKKVENKNITLTHYSDIIRMGVLSKYGGIWIDSTVFVSKPISSYKSAFFSIKQKRSYKKYVNNGNLWTSYLIGVPVHDTISKFVYDFFISYWKLNDYMIDYYLIDYVLSIAYDLFPQMRKAIQDNSFEYEKVYYFASIFDDKCNNGYVSEISTIPFSKLNWRYSIKKSSVGDYIIHKQLLNVVSTS